MTATQTPKHPSDDSSRQAHQAQVQDQTQVQPGSLRAWLLAARPATLSAALVPVAVGSACAYLLGGLAWAPALAAWWGATWLQIGSNLANDVFDFEKGADTEDRLGPTRAAQAGWLSPNALRIGMVAAFGFAFLAGVYLTFMAGWVIIAIGTVSIVCAIAYTGGPYPLGYHGLGDVFVMLFFGFVAVPGTLYVQMGHVPALAWWAAVPVGALATAILVVNNVRDAEQDINAGKRTLVVRFGRRAGVAEYVLLLAAAYAVPIFLCLDHTTRLPTHHNFTHLAMLLPCLTFPWALALIHAVVHRRGSALNATLASTAKLLLVFGLLFAASFVLVATLR